MKTKLAILLLAGLLSAPFIVRAQIDTNGLDANQLAHLSKIIQLAKNLKYREGEIDLRGGLARLNVPKEFRYL